jgi:hypothetical protein
MLGDTRGAASYMFEVGDAQRLQLLDLTNEECEAVRSYPACFFDVRRHEHLTAVVIEEAARFSIVEKRGGEREIVERSVPRAS